MTQWPLTPTIGDIEIELDRPNAILTSDDREFLADDAGDRSERASQEKRRRFRKRVRHSLMDGIFLAYCLDDEDLREIFSPRPNTGESADDVAGGALALLMFLYRGFDNVEGGFEGALRGAIQSVEQQRGWDNVEITYGVERRNRTNPVDLERAKERYESGEDITGRELGELVDFGVISTVELTDPDRWADLAERISPDERDEVQSDVTDSMGYLNSDGSEEDL